MTFHYSDPRDLGYVWEPVFELEVSVKHILLCCTDNISILRDNCSLYLSGQTTFSKTLVLNAPKLPVNLNFKETARNSNFLIIWNDSSTQA